MAKYSFDMKWLSGFPICALLISGCYELKSPRESFLTREKANRDSYFRLYETSIEALQEQQASVYRITTGIVQNLNQDLIQCTNAAECSLIRERLDRIQKTAEISQNKSDKLIAELKETYNPKTDCILLYDYYTTTNQEADLIIWNGKKIKKKIILGTGNSPL